MLGTIVRHAEGAHFDAGLRAFFAYRDLGVREASGGAFGVHLNFPIFDQKWDSCVWCPPLSL